MNNLLEKRHYNFKDLTGQRFGKLTVLELDGMYKSPSGKKHYTKWKCICDCENETVADAGDLKSGNTTSCGKCNPSRIYDNNLIDIRTPEAAYLLGFIWADGTIHVNSINSKSIDIKIVENDAQHIRPILEKIGKWTYCYPKTRGNCQQQCSMSCNDLETCNFLVENDYKSKSLAPHKILSQIPTELQHYWFRGDSDGDGCFFIKQYDKKYIYMFEMTGPFEQDWSHYENKFKDMDIKYRWTPHISKILKKNGEPEKWSRIIISNMYGIIKWGNYIYSGEQFGLSRKLEKFNQIRAYYDSRNVS